MSLVYLLSETVTFSMYASLTDTLKLASEVTDINPSESTQSLRFRLRYILFFFFNSGKSNLAPFSY